MRRLDPPHVPRVTVELDLAVFDLDGLHVACIARYRRCFVMELSVKYAAYMLHGTWGRHLALVRLCERRFQLILLVFTVCFVMILKRVLLGFKRVGPRLMSTVAAVASQGLHAQVRAHAPHTRRARRDNSCARACKHAPHAHTYALVHAPLG